MFNLYTFTPETIGLPLAQWRSLVLKNHVGLRNFRYFVGGQIDIKQRFLKVGGSNNNKSMGLLAWATYGANEPNIPLL